MGHYFLDKLYSEDANKNGQDFLDILYPWSFFSTLLRTKIQLYLGTFILQGVHYFGHNFYTGHDMKIEYKIVDTQYIFCNKNSGILLT